MGRVPLLIAAVALGALVGLPGCLTHRLRWPPERAAASKSPPTEPLATPPETPAEASAETPAAPQAPRSILALSGGGSYGAYTAGVLTGWSRTSKRPNFDVVTGVSTGALIAPLAFLGPKYDLPMAHFYTEVSQKNIFRFHYWAQIPFHSSAASAAPLRNILENGVTEEVVAAIGTEHKKGRRLYIATTHLAGRRTVVWDIGAIAARGEPDARELILNVMLASCSVPGVFPPVPLKIEVDGQRRTELHIDGGVTAAVFVPQQVLDDAKPPADLYVIVAGKFYPEAAAVEPRFLKVLSASGGALMHANTRRHVSDLYHAANLAGVNFHVAALRQDFPATDNGMEFEPNGMGRLFVEGVRVGLAGPGWQADPPERSPGEAGEIRTGSRFKTGP